MSALEWACVLHRAHGEARGACSLPHVVGALQLECAAARPAPTRPGSNCLHAMNERMTPTARTDRPTASNAHTLPLGTRVVALLCISAVALVLRVMAFPATNHDMIDHQVPWLSQLQQIGFWKAISAPFSQYGYTPFYTYAMGISNALFPTGTGPHPILKSIPVFFDFVAASLIYAIARLRWGDGWRSVIGFAAVLFAPTVFLNGAYWGQTDVIYTSFLLACAYMLLRRSDGWAMVYFGLALSVKLQAIWIGPFILMMVFRSRIRWWLLILPVIVYFVLALPTFVVGRSVAEVAGIYFTQAGTQSLLTYSAANLHFFPQYFFYQMGFWPQAIPVIAKASIVFAAVLSVLFAWKASKRELSDEALIVAIVVSELLVPQFLPHMHDRYFFAADVFLILLAVWNPRYLTAAVIMQFNSLVTYISFLWGKALLASPVPSVLQTLGFTNNLQWVTGLIVVAGVANFVLLLWFWRRFLQLQDEASGDQIFSVGIPARA